MELVFEQLNRSGCMSYLLASSKTGEAWLIDPLLTNVNDYLRLLESRRLKLIYAVDTHTHADHLSGCPKLRDETGCSYLMHANASPRCVSEKIADGQKLSIGGSNVRFMHTPGHTRDSLCLLLDDRILTGDTLFLDDGGAGRDDLPGGDPAEHWQSLARLKVLDDRLIVNPGHDYKERQPSNLGQQKLTNPFMKAHTQKEYVQFLEALKLGAADWMKKVLEANASCTRDLNCVSIPSHLSACEVQRTLMPSGTQEEPCFIEVMALASQLQSCNPPLLVDVRESHELVGELGHLPGIRHIPVGGFAGRVSELEDVKEREIVMICKMGGRARTAAKILLASGFQKVTVLTGGMTSWNEAGLPVESHDSVTKKQSY